MELEGYVKKRSWPVIRIVLESDDRMLTETTNNLGSVGGPWFTHIPQGSYAFMRLSVLEDRS